MSRKKAMTTTAEPVHGLQIAAGALGFAAEFASTEKTRYYLSGVYVEPCPAGGVLAVATDGRRMIAIYDANGRIERPAILRAQRNFLAGCRRRPMDIVTADTIARRFIACQMPTSSKSESAFGLIEEIDGTFPDWRKAIPATIPQSRAPVAFQARYLGAFDGLMRAGGRLGGIAILSDSLSGAAIVYPASPVALPWIGVVMPIAGTQSLSEYPEWLGLAQKPARATRRAA